MRSLLLLPCLAMTLAAQDAAQVQAPITSVKLYPDEAWVTRVAHVPAERGGARRYRIGGLPPGLTLDDIQVSAKGPAGSRLGDVTVSRDEDAATETPEWARFRSGREAFQDRMDALQSQSEAVTAEIAFLKGIQGAQSKELGERLTSAAPEAGPVVAFAQGMQARLAELLVKDRRLKRDLADLQKEQTRLAVEQARLKGQDRVAPSSVLIELSAASAGELEIQLSYRNRQARWSPVYEARLSEDRAKLDLALYAAVSQKSGEDWKGVRLEISNAKPSQGLDLPVYRSAQLVGAAPLPPPLPPGSANVDSIRATPTGRDFNSLAFLAPGVVNDPSMGAGSGAENEYVVDGQVTNDFSRGFQGASLASDFMDIVRADIKADIKPASLQTDTGLSLSLSLDGLKDVPSDGDAHRFKLLDQGVVPTMALVASPRLDTAVYQVARFKSLGGLPLFPGAPLVQYDGEQRLGQAPLATPPAGQPYQLGFGPFHGLRVTFHTDHKLGAVGTFSKERQWTYKDRAELSSDLATPVEVEVEDRILKPNLDTVKVSELPDTTPGAKEILPGVRAWSLHLEPGGTAGLTIASQVRGPAEGFVAGLDDAGLN